MIDGYTLASDLQADAVPKDETTIAQIVAEIQSLAAQGNEAAMEAIAQYAPLANESPRVALALYQAWSGFERVAFAEKVLSQTEVLIVQGAPADMPWSALTGKKYLYLDEVRLLAFLREMDSAGLVSIMYVAHLALEFRIATYADLRSAYSEPRTKPSLDIAGIESATSLQSLDYAESISLTPPRLPH